MFLSDQIIIQWTEINTKGIPIVKTVHFNSLNLREEHRILLLNMNVVYQNGVVLQSAWAAMSK
jgi:hypothetical protein